MGESKAGQQGHWAILELMGHAKTAGFVTEVERYGVKMGRIDVPDESELGFYTQFFGGSSVYRETPVSEEVARAFVRASQPRPVHTYQLKLAEPQVVEQEPELRLVRGVDHRLRDGYGYEEEGDDDERDGEDIPF